MTTSRGRKSPRDRQDLSLLSVEELTERIALMTSEIERLQAAMAKKRASKDTADRFFQIVSHSPRSGQAKRVPGRPVDDLRGEPVGQWPTWQTKRERNRSFTIIKLSHL